MSKTENDEQATTALTQDNNASTSAPADEEIHLLDLFIVLLKHKLMIIAVVFLTGIAAVAYSLHLPNIYRSEAVIAPAFVPEKKVKPERAQIVATSVAVAFFSAIFLAFILEYARNLKRPGKTRNAWQTCAGYGSSDFNRVKRKHAL